MYTHGNIYRDAGKTMRDQIGAAALKASPALAVGAWDRLAAIPPSDWLTYTTILYVLLQAGVLIRKEFFKRRIRRSDKRVP